MSNEMDIGGTETVQALLIFPLAETWKHLLLIHGCTFGVHVYGDLVIFPEGTTRTLLYDPNGQATNRYRIVFPDGLELREVLDDEGEGKSWLAIVITAPLGGTKCIAECRGIFP